MIFLTYCFSLHENIWVQDRVINNDLMSFNNGHHGWLLHCILYILFLFSPLLIIFSFKFLTVTIHSLQPQQIFLFLSTVTFQFIYFKVFKLKYLIPIQKWILKIKCLEKKTILYFFIWWKKIKFIWQL